MSDLSDRRPSDTTPLMKGSHCAQRQSAVSRSEEKLAAARLALVQAKRQLREASVRARSIREGVLGRAVWQLIEQGTLEPCAIALIQDAVRPFLTPARASAFVNTIFELPPMPAGEPANADAPVPLAETGISPTQQLTTRFRLPARPASA
jgi:hypothetical protein